MKYIDGGVCAPKGFKAGGIHCGIRSKDTAKKDLAMITSDTDCSAAAVYTRNKVKGAPIQVTREHLSDGKARAIICNSGNANTCATNGVDIARRTCQLAAGSLGVKPEAIIVCSTGVIGEPLSIEPFERGIGPLAKKLDYDGGTRAAEAIMTTDTVSKETAVEFQLDGKRIRIGGTAKGSGMIHPDMATMLSFITTDVNISPDMLKKALSRDVKDTFNQLSVDGDTSTNDTVCVMANGMAQNKEIVKEGEAYETFCKALSMVTTALVRMLAADGEGASRLVECHVSGASEVEAARVIARTVVSSDLFKTAIFGADANWGRILCAIGYAPAEFRADCIDVDLASEKGRISVCKNSAYYPFSEEEAAEILQEDEIQVYIHMNQGNADAMAWGCDLTYEYVKINGEYRS